MGGTGTGVGLSSGAAGAAAMGFSCRSDGGSRSAASSPQTFFAPPVMPPSAAAAAAAAAAPTAVPEVLQHMLHTRPAVLGQQLQAGAGACESADPLSSWHEYSEPAVVRPEHLLHTTADAGSVGAESYDDDAGLSPDYPFPRSSLRRQQPPQHTPQQHPLLQASQSSRSIRAEQQQLQPQQLQPQQLQPQQLQPQSASSPDQPRAPVVPRLRLPASTAASPQQTLTHAASAASLLGNGPCSDDDRGRLVVNDLVAHIVEQHDAATAAAAAAAAKLAPTRLTYSGSAAKALPVLTDADGMNGYLEELLLPPAHHTGAAQLQQRRRTTPLRLATLPPPPSPPDTARTRGLKATVAAAMATVAAAAALEGQWREEAPRGGEGGSCRDAGPGAGRGSQQQSRSASVQGLGQAQQVQGQVGGEASRLRLPEALVREVVSRGRGRS